MNLILFSFSKMIRRGFANILLIRLLLKLNNPPYQIFLLTVFKFKFKFNSY